MDDKRSMPIEESLTGKRIRLDTLLPPCQDSLTNESFTVGWICALAVELAASVAMLDEEFPSLPQAQGDSNTYTLGRIGQHNLVLACLPAGTTGTNAAAVTATNMPRSFPKIRFRLMVGIGGGAPSQPSDDPRKDIRLGDVVVSCPEGDSSKTMLNVSKTRAYIHRWCSTVRFW